MRFLIHLAKKYITREIIVYLICGVLTTIVGWAVYWICDQLNAGVVVSNTIASVIAVAFAFVVNKIYVFRFLSWEPKTVLREATSFAAGRAITYVMETVLLILLVDVLLLPSFPCKMFTSVLVVIGNYVISKFAVFIRKKETLPDVK